MGGFSDKFCLKIENGRSLQRSSSDFAVHIQHIGFLRAQPAEIQLVTANGMWLLGNRKDDFRRTMGKLILLNYGKRFENCSECSNIVCP